MALLNQILDEFVDVIEWTNPAATNIPPPIPIQRQYFVAANGQKIGPFDLATILQKISQGEVIPLTLIWYHLLTTWILTEQVAKLKHLFTQMPPPIPST